MVETSGVWPQGLLDAFFAMIPKADGDSTPLGQRLLSVLPVVYRLWASLRLGHLREWVVGWLPKSVFSLANGLSSVDASFSTALDIEDRSCSSSSLSWRRGEFPWSRLRTMDSLQLQLIDKVFEVPVCRPSSFLECSR